MNRAFSHVTVRSVNEDRRELEGWATTPAPDRVGDIVQPEGARFELPLPLLLDHDHSKVVGEVYHAEVSAQGIRFWAKVQKIAEPGAAKDLVDYAWSLIRNGLRRTVSIGFRALNSEALPSGGLKFLAWEWLELSAVGVPAQSQARITGTKGLKSQRVVKIGRAKTVSGISPSRLSTPAEVRSAKGAELLRCIQRDREYFLDHAPLRVAIMSAKGGDELRRVIARSRRELSGTVVRL